MRTTVPNQIACAFTILLLLLTSLTRNATAAVAPSILQAKKEAQAKGYIFFTTHDEIVAMAKKERKLGVVTGLESANFKPLINGFIWSRYGYDRCVFSV